jgi:two-component system response regulator ResD
MNEQPTERARILVADDDRNIVDLVRMYLAKAGYDVTIARDGDEAQRRLRESEFDLAILDIMMPGPDYPDAAKAQRAAGDFPVGTVFGHR